MNGLVVLEIDGSLDRWICGGSLERWICESNEWISEPVRVGQVFSVYSILVYLILGIQYFYA